MAAAVLAGAAPAGAATYTVQQCLPGNTTEAEFLTVTNKPSIFYAANQCGTGGFLLGSVWGNTVFQNDGIAAITYAPDGTVIKDFRASFTGYAMDGIQTAASMCHDLACGSQTALFNGLNNFPTQQVVLWSGAAVAVRAHLTCTGWGGANGCSWGVGPLLEIYGPRFVMEDLHAPGVTTSGGSLVGGWKRGIHSLPFTASDRGGGVVRARLLIGGTEYGNHEAGCARTASTPALWAKLRPCPSDVNGSIGIDLNAVPEGVHQARVEVSDPAGQPALSQPFEVRVDRTPPAPPSSLAVDGGEGWRSTLAFGASWENPDELHAPISAARWRLCPLQGGACAEGRSVGAEIKRMEGIQAPGQGQYDLAIWLEDAAGNHDPVRARHARVSIDLERPRLVFDDLDPDAPSRVSVSALDELSGIAGGEIEMRAVGGASWHPLGAGVAGGRLVAHVDDERFRRGDYEFRAFAVDAAGNEGSTDRRANGSTMSLRLPVRIETRLRAGVARTRGRGRKRRRVLEPAWRVPAGQPVRLSGILRNADGQPIDGAEIQTFTRARLADDEFRLAGLLRTDLRGRFTYRIAPRESKVVRFRYPGSARIMGGSDDVSLLVPAASSIRASDRVVALGETVVFSGRLRTRPAPPGGKLVEMQSFFRDRWRTFSTVRTDARGRWSFPYSFTGTVGRVRYRFRVRIPFEGGYLYDAGRSRAISVLVNGS